MKNHNRFTVGSGWFDQIGYTICYLCNAHNLIITNFNIPIIWRPLIVLSDPRNGCQTGLSPDTLDASVPRAPNHPK